MEAFLKIVFILVLVYYTFKLMARYVFPWLLSRFVKKQQEKFFGQKPPFEGGQGPKAKGNTIHKEKKTEHKDDKSFGEYIDFEDIKE